MSAEVRSAARSVVNVAPACVYASFSYPGLHSRANFHRDLKATRDQLLDSVWKQRNTGLSYGCFFTIASARHFLQAGQARTVHPPITGRFRWFAQVRRELPAGCKVAVPILTILPATGWAVA